MIISDFAIKRPLITVVVMVAMVIFGIFALLKLKTDEFPDVAPPWLTIGVIYLATTYLILGIFRWVEHRLSGHMRERPSGRDAKASTRGLKA